MLQQEQEIGDAAGASLLDELALKRESLRVGNDSESPYLEGPAAFAGSELRRAHIRLG